MIAAVSLIGYCYYPLKDLYDLAKEVLPSTDHVKECLEVYPYTSLDEGLFSAEWKLFAEKFPGGKAVKIIHGIFPRGTAKCKGNNLFLNSSKIILIDEVFQECDKYAALFACKHEFAHIRNCDSVYRQSLLLIISLIASSVLPTWGWPLMLGYVTHERLNNTILYRSRESKADQFAIENSTEEELKGGLRLFEAFRQLREKSAAPTMLNRIIGLCKSLFTKYPSDLERVKNIEKKLKSRFFYTDESLKRLKNSEELVNLKLYLKVKGSFQNEMEKTVDIWGYLPEAAERV